MLGEIYCVYFRKENVEQLNKWYMEKELSLLWTLAMIINSASLGVFKK